MLMWVDLRSQTRWACGGRRCCLANDGFYRFLQRQFFLFSLSSLAFQWILDRLVFLQRLSQEEGFGFFSRVIHDSGVFLLGVFSLEDDRQVLDSSVVCEFGGLLVSWVPSGFQREKT